MLGESLANADPGPRRPGVGGSPGPREPSDPGGLGDGGEELLAIRPKVPVAGPGAGYHSSMANSGWWVGERSSLR